MKCIVCGEEFGAYVMALVNHLEEHIDDLQAHVDELADELNTAYTENEIMEEHALFRSSLRAPTDSSTK